jgi:FAD/FMN-containing dehydrogenase
MNSNNRAYLEEKFKHRVTFDPVERMLYGHDIAAIPELVRPLIGNTTPDAVVQPQDEDEIIELIKWARIKQCGADAQRQGYFRLWRSNTSE